jgi:predicted transcriptional regulator
LTISAIARHLGHDHKTIRDYLEGKRVPFEEFAEYCRIRLADDPGRP